ELAHELLAQLLPDRPDDVVRQRRADHSTAGLAVDLECSHDSHDVAERDTPSLAAQPITAIRAALAGKDARTHEMLQHLLEIAPRNFLTARDVGAADSRVGAMHGNVEDRLDREHRFPAELWHLLRCQRRSPLAARGAGAARPVDPKPPLPRSLAGNC